MIPFHKVSLSKNEKNYIDQVYQSGKFCGDGSFGKKCEAYLKNLTQSQHMLVTSSCTHALDMAMELIAPEGDSKKEDSKNEVLLPSFTFSSTANCILLAGLKPVFCDIDPVTLNISISEIEKKISDKTLAIIPVHYAGIACPMDEILALAAKYKCYVVEDAAHAIGAKYKGKAIGSLSDISLFSFHETKNISCGEGGAFATNNDSLYEKALIYREKGTNRSQFIRGLVDKYTWVAKGSSPLLAEPLSAILLGQLESLTEFNAERKMIYTRYLNSLKYLENRELVTLPTIPDYCDSNYHLFHMLLDSEAHRNSLLDYLRKNQVGATFHYIPLHNSPLGKKLHLDNDDLPVTDDIHLRLLRLPLYPDLTPQEFEKINQTIFDWQKTL